MYHPVALITHADCLRHVNCAPGHPESPARLQRLRQWLSARSETLGLKWIEADKAIDMIVERVHPPGYVDWLRQLEPSEGCLSLNADTGLRAGSVEAALFAAGSVAQAVDGVCDGKWRRAFCAVRPPGHHAEPREPMGFCLVNNIAVGVAHAQVRGMRRIAVVDFDVHHGNGTETFVAGRKEVRLYSLFQHPFYPYRGVAPQARNCIGVPLPAGTTGERWRQAVRDHVLFDLRAWRPELIMVSAGFDGHAQDPLGGWALTADDYFWVGRALAQAADECAQGALISVLEGGYELHAQAESVEAYLKGQSQTV